MSRVFCETSGTFAFARITGRGCRPVKSPHALPPNLGWLACVVYSTIPLFWLMVHPRAHRWRAREKSPFRVLVPAWIVMWVGVGALTGPWRNATLYSTPISWVPAAALFVAGILIYLRSGAHFSWAQFGGLPEVHAEAMLSDSSQPESAPESATPYISVTCVKCWPGA